MHGSWLPWGTICWRLATRKNQLEACVCAIEKEFGIKAVPLCLDLAVADAAERLFSYCIENGITVDILINNAGVFIFNDIVDTSPQRLETMMVLHMNTVTMLCRLFGSGMKTGEGDISSTCRRYLHGCRFRV